MLNVEGRSCADAPPPPPAGFSVRERMADPAIGGTVGPTNAGNHHGEARDEVTGRPGAELRSATRGSAPATLGGAARRGRERTAAQRRAPPAQRPAPHGSHAVVMLTRHECRDRRLGRVVAVHGRTGVAGEELRKLGFSAARRRARGRRRPGTVVRTPGSCRTRGTTRRASCSAARAVGVGVRAGSRRGTVRTNRGAPVTMAHRTIQGDLDLQWCIAPRRRIQTRAASNYAAVLRGRV